MTHILLVEDDPALARMFLRILGKQGYTVHHVASVREARAALDEHQAPDILLTDRDVPDGNAWDLRAYVEPARTKVVLMTGNPPHDPPPFFQKGTSISILLKMLEAT